MSITRLLTQQLEIRRSGTPSGVDEDNLPLYGADTVIATVAGLVQPLSVREQVELADAGPVAFDSRGFLNVTDILAADRVRVIDTNETFEVRAVERHIGRNLQYLYLSLHRETA